MNKTLAVIDIGSNSIRMVLGQLLPDGTAQVLERFRKAVRLGQDTFTKGKLGKEAIRTVISILREYQKTLKLYNVEHIRIVATSAVREAGNAEILIDRVLTATGLEIEIIDMSEESRLTVLAVQNSLGVLTGKIRTNSLIIEVGGGHTTITVLEKGEIVVSNSLYLGSIRLREALSGGTSADSKMIRNELVRFLPSIESFMSLGKIETFFALGADARFAAQEAGIPVKGTELSAIPKDKYNKMVNKITSKSPEELTDLYNIEFTDAETLNVALLVYQELLNSTKSKELIVSFSSMREELLQDLARRITGTEDKTFAHGVIHSATAIAEKYKVDIEHSNRVRKIAVKLFDALEKEHGLKFRHRVLLEAAAILHEVGTFISPRGFHKHSYYLIKNSEIFGLNQTEVGLVANIARYHRRAQPKASHLEYMALSRDQRIIVNKLAALLRIAEPLDAGHNINSVNIKCDVDKNNLILSIPGMKDLVLKKRILSAGTDMFEDIYGLSTKLEEI